MNMYIGFSLYAAGDKCCMAWPHNTKNMAKHFN